jgi:hypothetical protein
MKPFHQQCRNVTTENINASHVAAEKLMEIVGFDLEMQQLYTTER